MNRKTIFFIGLLIGSFFCNAAQAQVVWGEVNLLFAFEHDYVIVADDPKAEAEIVCHGVEIDFFEVDVKEDMAEEMAIWTVEYAEMELELDVVGQVHLMDVDGMDAAWVQVERNDDPFILIGIYDEDRDAHGYFLVDYEEDEEEEVLHLIRTLRRG